MMLDEQIVAAWPTKETAAAISLRLTCSERHVRNVWKAAQASGVLPAGSRPQFSAACGLTKEADVEIDYENMSDADFARVEAEEAALARASRAAAAAGSDALLAALKRAHVSPATLAPDICEADRLTAAHNRLVASAISRAPYCQHAARRVSEQVRA